MSDYPYDDEVLDEVTRRLFDAVPAMYRVPDGPPAGRGELTLLLEVLAAPLAVVRQSIQELHADLFIDTADDRMIPYLAEMVGTRLVFPDAESNRRDVRGTVGWRRRKGTPAALEEMGGELTGQSIVLQEGWKRIQLAQDLTLLRPERVVPDLRAAVVAEQATGPLDALFHAVDVRRISATTGRYHPHHVAHWLQPTITFPLAGATAAGRSQPDSDVRYAMDPLGVRRPTRARRIAGDREPFVDRIAEQHFAATPERWFGRPGGFTVRVCGLPAAVAGTARTDRVATARAADALLGRGDVVLTVLDRPSRGWRGAVGVELGLAAIGNVGAGGWRPDPTSFAVRGRVDLDAAGAVGAPPTGGAGPVGARVPMLRLRALGGAPGTFFPGATLEIASAAAGSTAAAQDSALAREGFLRGALHVQIPALEIRGDRLLHIAADGSLYEARDRTGAVIDMPRVDDDPRLAPTALLVPGPGPAWPPVLPQSEPRMLNRVPAAPGNGPTVLHGSRPLLQTGAGFAQLPPAADCALAFAAQLENPGGPVFRPFQRLSWTGRDPRSGTWTAVDRNGLPVGADRLADEYAAVAAQREADPDRVALAVRFECSAAGATLCPGEIAWCADDGRTVLIHLPQLDAAAVPAGTSWPAAPGFAFASAGVRVAEDGSTWASTSTAGARVALGEVAPIAEAAALRRRRVHGRRLCAWDQEDWDSPPQTLPLTERGSLDIDVIHGLFAFSADEPPQVRPTGPGGGAVPPSVTVDYEEGATMHVGALAAAREPVLDLRLPRPTRLVSRSGALHRDAPADWHTIPRYVSLTAALAAVSTDWQSLAQPGDVAEVVQFEDSATYPAQAPRWPVAPADQAVREGTRLSLTIQAAERERPTVLVDPAWTVPPSAPEYAAITLRGIAFGGAGWPGMTLPPAARVTLELCTVLHAGNRIEFADVATGAQVRVTRCMTAGLVLAGAGQLVVSDSIVDARPHDALVAPAGMVTLDRVSVGGEVRVRAIEASEVIFDGRVTVEDRFRGCVRYSRVAEDSVLPRVHRVVVGTPVRVVTLNRRDPAWWRLRADCDTAISRGAESGSEMGAFNLIRSAERMVGFEQRLGEFTPAGLVSGIIRID
ncbi:MAG TPA: phage tail protein [Nakamurella sp.]